MDKKKIVLALTLAIILASVAVVYASYWIYSSTVTVTVTEYVLSLVPTNQNIVRYHNATFTATLKLDDVVVSGATIYLFKDSVSTGVSNVTESDGTCTLSYNMTEPSGTYNFTAGYKVT